MAQAPATVVQEINGLYVALYGRAADGLGISYWISQVATYDPAITLANAATTPISTADAAWLGQQFVATQSTYFNAQYGGLNDTQFIQALYVNIGGNTGDPAGVQYWLNLLTVAEASGQSVQAARAGLIGQFAHDMLSIDLTVGAAALGLSASDYAAAVARQQEFQNKVSVSQYYAIESTLPGGNILVAATTSSPAFTAAMDAIAAVTSNSATVTTAEAAIALAVSTASLAPITSLPTTAAGQSFTLTTGTDNITPPTTNNNTVNGLANGPGATFTPGDTINLGSTSGNTLNLSDISAGGTWVPAILAGVTISGIQTANLSSAEAVTVNTVTSTQGWTGLTQMNVNDNGATSITVGSATNVAANSTGAITVSGGANVSTTQSNAGGALTISGEVGTVTVNDLQGANSITINNGTAITVTATGVTSGTIVIGGTTSPSGAISVTTTDAQTATAIAGAITVTGGSSVTINEALSVSSTLSAAVANATTVVGNTVTVNGSAATTSVSVTQSTAAAATAAVAGVVGVVPVSAVTASPGVQGVTAVAGVLPVAAVTGNPGVVDGAVVITDANAASASIPNTITSVTLQNYGAGSTIADNALTTLTLGGTAGTLSITNSATTPTNTTLALTLNNLSGADTITDVHHEIKTLSVTTGVGNSTLSAVADTSLTTLNVAGSYLLTLSAINSTLTTLAVTGAAGFNDGDAHTYTGGLAALHGALTITDTSSGAFTAALDDTTQAFVGSTGQDIITINSQTDATKAITAGSATNNELILDGGAYGLTAATAALVTGFEILGVTGSVTGTIDMSKLDPTADALDIIGNSTIAFIKVAKGAALSLDANSTSVSVSYADATGVTDTTTVTFGAASNTNALTATALLLQDANSVGIGTVNLISNDSTFDASNTIGTLTDNGLSQLNVSGTGGLTITTLNEATTQATSFVLNNTETNAAGVTIGTFTDNNLGALTFTGTNASSITTFDDSGSAVLAIANTGTSTASIGTISDNILTSLTLGAGVALGQGSSVGAETTIGLQDTVTAGVTVSGSSDNAHVTIVLAGAASGKTDSITLGNGNNYIQDSSSAGTINVVVGTGSNYIDLGIAHNTTGAYNVTLGTHTAASGIDLVEVGSSGTNFASAANVVITGAVTGDQLAFLNDLGNATTVLTVVPTQSSLALAISAVETAAAAAAHDVSFTVFGGNTYVAENNAGAAASATNTTLVELIGTHTFTAGTGLITIAS